MNTSDKKILTGLFSAVVLHALFDKNRNSICDHPESAAEECVRIAKIFVEKLGQEFECIDE